MLLPKNTLKRENPGKYLSFPVSKEVARAGPGSLCCEAGLLPGTPSGPHRLPGRERGAPRGRGLAGPWLPFLTSYCLLSPAPPPARAELGPPGPRAFPGRAGLAKVLPPLRFTHNPRAGGGEAIGPRRC